MNSRESDVEMFFYHIKIRKLNKRNNLTGPLLAPVVVPFFQSVKLQSENREAPLQCDRNDMSKVIILNMSNFQYLSAGPVCI